MYKITIDKLKSWNACCFKSRPGYIESLFNGRSFVTINDLNDMILSDNDINWILRRIIDEIGFLPSEVGNLKWLRWLTHLDLSNTDIKQLPFEIGNLKNLEWLDLSNTKINKNLEGIKKLKKNGCVINF